MVSHHQLVSLYQQVRSFSKGKWLLATEDMPLVQSPKVLHSDFSIATYQILHISHCYFRQP